MEAYLALAWLAVCICVGLILGLKVQASTLTKAAIHYTMASMVVLIGAFGSYKHFQRLREGRQRLLAWQHFAYFGLFGLLAAWGATHHARHVQSLREAGVTLRQSVDDRILLTVDGECKDATAYAKLHPGGVQALMRGRGKPDLAEHWKGAGKHFHLSNGALEIARGLPSC